MSRLGRRYARSDAVRILQDIEGNEVCGTCEKYIVLHQVQCAMITAF